MSDEAAKSAEELLGELEAQASLQSVIQGFMSGVGGARAVGRMLAALAKDDDTPPATRAAVFNNMLNMMAKYGTSDGGTGNLVDEEQLAAGLRQFEDRMKGRGK